MQRRRLCAWSADIAAVALLDGLQRGGVSKRVIDLRARIDDMCWAASTRPARPIAGKICDVGRRSNGAESHDGAMMTVAFYTVSALSSYDLH